MTRVLRITLLLFVGAIAAPFSQIHADNERPICRIAAVSNLYLTSLSKEELGAKRSFIATTAPQGIKKTIETVNGLEPDAVIVMGSLSWTGSANDFAVAKQYLEQIKAPVHVAPGVNDLPNGKTSEFEKHFGSKSTRVRWLNVKGVHLQIAMPSAERSGKADLELLDSVRQGLGQKNLVKGVLLFGGPEVNEIADDITPSKLQADYWKAIHDHRVGIRFTAGHAHTIRYQDRLPIFSLPSTGWSYSPKFALALITVYEKKIEVTLVRDASQPVQSIVVPNPVAAPRMPRAKDDQYQVPTLTEDLAKKPELTFVQLSDSQFDDKTLSRYTARYHYDEQMNKLAVKQVNRLNPSMVFMTGDLTNKNTETEWKTFGDIYGKLKPTLYAMPGNHDTLYDRSKLDEKTLGDLLEPGKKNWQLADKLTGEKTLDRTTLFRHFIGREPYYAVEKNGCVFLCLNTGVASVDRDQMQWLRKELERTKNAKHVFVLGHYPVLPAFGNSIQGPEAEEILVLLRQYKVTAYLSGHRHRYDYRMHDGVMHILCDCLCWGEYRSYQIYHVFDDHIVACWKPIFRADGNRPLYERVKFPEPRFRN